jgi:polyhydroxyalkanoate synthesis regulator phasin
MKKSRLLALLVVVSTLGACEFAESAVAPSVAGGTPTTAQPATIVPLDASKLGQPSGTSAGTRIAQFHGDLTQLQQAAIQQVQRGRQLQATMEASVASYQISAGKITPNQQGATVSEDSVGNWRNAQTQLQTISATLDQMGGLSNEAAKNVAYAAFLLQSIRETNAAPDATEEDRRQLRVLEESTSQTSTSLDQLLDALRQDVQRQSHFLGSEGAKLAQKAPPSVGAPANVATPPQQSTPQQPTEQSAHVAGPAGAGLASGRPFIVIRFDNPGVEYKQQLYEAVSAALARSPDVAFDIVAVAPATGTPEEIARNSEAARANTEKVTRSLMNMGFPADRVSVSQMTDPNVQSNEVHLYVR